MDTDEIFRSSVEAARRSVARQGFLFMRVAGSDPRILNYILRSPNLLGGSVIPSLLHE